MMKKWHPDLNHFEHHVWDEVYEPSEDSFALEDALNEDRDLLCSIVRPKLCIEIGPGSGYVTACLAHLLTVNHSCDAMFFDVDINRTACQATRSTWDHQSTTSAPSKGESRTMMRLEVIQGDLAMPLMERMKGEIDVLIFNPPYVPSEPEETGPGTAIINRAFAGGPGTGTSVLERLLPHVGELLSPRGCFYVVAISENKPKETIVMPLLKQGLVPKVLIKRQEGIELLFVIRFTRRQSSSSSSSSSPISSKEETQ